MSTPRPSLRSTALLAAVLTVGGLIATAEHARAGEAVRWVKSVSAAKKQAAAEKKVVMVDFYTDWCGYCKKLDAETYPNAAVVKELKTNFVSVKLDAEREGAALAKQFNVRGYPTILFLNSKGQEITRIPGFMPAKEFTAALKQVHSQAKR